MSRLEKNFSVGMTSPDEKEFDDIRHTPYVPSEEQFSIIREEMKLAAADPKSSRRTAVMIKRALKEPMTHPRGSIDWKKELRAFGELDYPEYYLKPFHSVAGGWLSKRASTMDRMFMQGIYRDAHAESCQGLRAELSKMVPADSRRVVDLGSGCCDGPAITAKTLPNAQVFAVEASPFMLTCGRKQNPSIPNLQFIHALAEDTGLPDGSIDCVTVTLLFHECPYDAKVAIAQEAQRMLRPGGTLVFADTPQDDLHTYVGAHEPFRDGWRDFKPAEFFTGLGFRDFRDFGVLGGTRKVVSEEEQRTLTGERTDNRLFACTAVKAIPSKL